jgi:hypothetical protein
MMADKNFQLSLLLILNEKARSLFRVEKTEMTSDVTC